MTKSLGQEANKYPILGLDGYVVDLVPYSSYLRIKAMTAVELLLQAVSCAARGDLWLADLFYQGACFAIEDARKARVNAKRNVSGRKKR